MKHSLRLEHITLTDLDTAHLEDKLNRIEKHLAAPYTVDVTITHDTHHAKGNVVTCTIIIEQGKEIFRAERTSDTVPNAIDASISALKSSLLSSHERRKEHK